MLQVVGVGFGAFGLITTWKVFSKEPILKSLSDAVCGVVQRLVSRFRRPRPVSGAGEVTARSGAEGRLSVGWGPLPTDRGPAIDELERRSNDLLRRISDNADRLADERKATEKAFDELRGSLATSVADLNEQDRKVATGGVRWALVGALLIALGLLCQLVSVVLAARGGG